MSDYDHKSIESKWQKKWEEDGLYKTSDSVSGKENEYILVEFPYPSGNLHVGHWYAFAVSDIYARYRKAQGKNVMFPIGFDAFGLPAENAAIKNNLNPRDWTYQNMEVMREQLKSMGAMFDWSREVATCDPSYYKWTQFLFLELYKAGLVEKKITIVNWDPVDKTVLANEQVLADGTADRSGAQVEKKELEQWTVKITDYADRLINDLDDLDWPESIKDSQRNWIGRSQGAEFVCNIKDLNIEVRMYNSVPQTFMAETFTAIAPEHPLIKELVKGTEYEKNVLEYVKQIKERKLKDKFSVEKEQKGIFTGRYIENFCGTGKDLPIWVAPYAIYDYGTGIVNASAHDERDFTFAKENGILLHPVMFPEDEVEAKKVRNQEYAYCRDPQAIIEEPIQFKGRRWSEAREEIIDYLVDNGYAERRINFKLRDWTVSRQRYWGCPIPIINCSECGPVPVPKDQLPVELPEVENYLPRDDGKSPLAKATEWMNVSCPKCKGAAERETDTLDTFADSSWYFLRYTDPNNTEEFASKEKLSNWMPVDFYSGGAEHTTMHLLYSRFFHKALFDRGLVNEKEPYVKRLNRGLIIGTDGNKMSKSKGNVIDPDGEVSRLGADTVRTYLAFIGPYNEPGNYPWDPNGIVGVRRFIERVFTVSEKITDETSEDVKRLLHQTIKKVGEDSARLKFNTAISQLMVLTSEIQKSGISREDSTIAAILVSPFAPHVAEELWYTTGGEGSVHDQDWPKYDEALLISDTMTIAIQINGKVRDQIEVSIDTSEDEIKALVVGREVVKKWLEGTEPKKVIYVKGKLISIVT